MASMPNSSRRAIERDPGFFSSYAILGLSYAGKGMYDEGVRELRMAVSLGGGAQAKGELAYALARSGRAAEASRIIDELKLLPERYSLAFDIAAVYAGLGDNEHAF